MNEINFDALYSDCTNNFVIPMEPECNSEVRIRFRTAKEDVLAVTLCITSDVEEEFKFIDMEKHSSDEYFDFYEARVSLKEEKLTYYFKIEGKNEIYYYNKFGVRTLASTDGDYFDFAIIPGFKTPDWAKGAVMYQIYVDRFNNGDKSNDVENREYTYINKYSTAARSWDSLPESMDIHRFYGGDLQGVIDKMDYLRSLGIQAIYFNPLFVSPSNHKYDTQDYDNIDPHIGVIINDCDGVLQNGDKCNKNSYKYIKRVTDQKNLKASNELFIKLVETAHKNGIKVIIDGVFNHCGSFNKWMDAEGIYECAEGYEKGAFVSKESPYLSFFHFDKDNWPYNNEFEGWWGHKTLPKLGYEDSPKLVEYIMHIARKWVSAPYNADGWRLDVAADLGRTEEFNHRFWKEFRNNVKSANKDAIIIAEHYGNPRKWLLGDEWDTVMNYDAFMEPVTWFLTGMEKHSDGKSDALKNNSKAFSHSMRHFMANFTAPSMLVAMNQLSNHDHSRFMTRTNGVVGRIATHGASAAKEGIDKAVMKEAVIMQMTLPGAPTLYYGDEAGVCGWTDPDSRRTYPWGEEDFELMEFHRDMIRIHKSNEALKIGSFKVIYEEMGVLAYARFTKKNKVIVIINNSDNSFEGNIEVWQAGVNTKDVMERVILSSRDNYNAGKVKMSVWEGVMRANVPAKSGAVYIAQAQN